MVPNQVDSCLCPPVRAFSTYDCVSDRDSVCVHYRLSIRLCNPQPRGMDSKRIPRNNLTTFLQLHRWRKSKNKVYRALVDNRERNTHTTMIVCLFVCLFQYRHSFMLLVVWSYLYNFLGGYYIYYTPFDLNQVPNTSEVPNLATSSAQNCPPCIGSIWLQTIL